MFKQISKDNNYVGGKSKGLKVYFSALNLYTFHDVDFWDPERGLDGMGTGVYPMTKSFVGGIEVSF